MKAFDVITQLIFRLLAIVLVLAGGGYMIASLNGIPSTKQFIGGAIAALVGFTLGYIADKTSPFKTNVNETEENKS